jgi:hypothetical protein
MDKLGASVIQRALKAPGGVEALNLEYLARQVYQVMSREKERSSTPVKFGFRSAS